MHLSTPAMLATALLAGAVSPTFTQGPPRTLVAVFAHADDELSVGPVLARYAREGAQVHLVIATDGAQGASNTSVPPGPEIAKLRVEEARCAAQALGIAPPILLGFPDAGLGNSLADPTLLFRLTQRLQEEIQRLRPDVVVTWGPEGGTGHPDHRLVSAVVSQLARAGAPGVPQRVFYASLPAEAFRALNPDRGAPPLLIPRADLFTARVRVTDADLDAAHRSMACHKTQFPAEVIDRVSRSMTDIWKGELPLAPMVPQPASDDLFR